MQIPKHSYQKMHRFSGGGFNFKAFREQRQETKQSTANLRAHRTLENFRKLGNVR